MTVIFFSFSEAQHIYISGFHMRFHCLVTAELCQLITQNSKGKITLLIPSPKISHLSPYVSQAVHIFWFVSSLFNTLSQVNWHSSTHPHFLMSVFPMISNRSHIKEQHRTLFQRMLLVRNVLFQNHTFRSRRIQIGNKVCTS